LGVAWPPPFGLGWFRPPQIGRFEVAVATPFGQNGVARGTLFLIYIYIKGFLIILILIFLFLITCMDTYLVFKGVDLDFCKILNGS
jgi:hypothetical protein